MNAEIIWMLWWSVGFVYAIWAWRLEFDVTLSTILFAAVFCAMLGPVLGLSWHLLWYFEHNPVKLPTITILKRKQPRS